MEFKIDDELQALIPPIHSSERELLEANILERGCRDPLVIWEEENTLLDGHNRAEIFEKHEITEFPTEKISLPDRESAIRWILNNQLGRRNLTREQVAYLRGKRYNLEKVTVTNPKGNNQHQQVVPHFEGQPHTAERLAEEFKVAPATMERDGKFASALDHIANQLGNDWKNAILNRDYRVGKIHALHLSELADKDPEKAKGIANHLLSGDTKLFLQELKMLEIEEKPQREVKISDKEVKVVVGRITDMTKILRKLSPKLEKIAKTNSSSIANFSALYESTKALFDRIKAIVQPHADMAIERTIEGKDKFATAVVETILEMASDAKREEYREYISQQPENENEEPAQIAS